MNDKTEVEYWRKRAVLAETELLATKAHVRHAVSLAVALRQTLAQLMPPTSEPRQEVEP